MEFDITKLLAEEVIDLSQARAEFESLFGEQPTQSTINRWVKNGYQNVRLEAVRCGKKYATSKQAVRRFIEKINK